MKHPNRNLVTYFRQATIRRVFVAAFLISLVIIAIFSVLRWQGDRNESTVFLPESKKNRPKVATLVYEGKEYYLANMRFYARKMTHKIDRQELETLLGFKLKASDVTTDSFSTSLIRTLTESYASHLFWLYFVVEVTLLSIMLVLLYLLLFRVSRKWFVPMLTAMQIFLFLILVNYNFEFIGPYHHSYRRIFIDFLQGFNAFFFTFLLVTIPVTLIILATHILEKAGYVIGRKLKIRNMFAAKSSKIFVAFLVLASIFHFVVWSQYQELTLTNDYWMKHWQKRNKASIEFIELNQELFSDIFTYSFQEAKACPTKNEEECRADLSQQIFIRLKRPEDSKDDFSATYFIRLSEDDQIEKLFLSGNFKSEVVNTGGEKKVKKLLLGDTKLKFSFVRQGYRHLFCIESHLGFGKCLRDFHPHDVQAEDIILITNDQNKMIGAVVRIYGQ